MLNHRGTVPSAPSRVVVLGASGFVGTDLMRHLDTLGVPAVGLSSAQLDLCRPESVERLGQIVQSDEALVIVSALTPDKGKDTATLMKNLAMGATLCTSLSRSTPAHVIYVSSDAVYAEEANPVTERSRCEPASLHGLMHLTRERMFAHALQAIGVPFAVLRPCALYGSGDTHSGYGPNRFLRTAREEQRITLFGHGEEKRDHLFIEDLSRVIGLCLEFRSEGVLNVATGRSVSFMEVARRVAGLFDQAVSIESTPRKTPITHRHFDTAELLRAFPSFRPTAMEAGLSETAKNTLVLHG